MKLQFPSIEYLEQIQQIIQKVSSGKGHVHDLTSCIERYRLEFPQNLSLVSFFKAERAFFSGNYELALKFYLQARGIPYFSFFCYRASAFVSQNLGNFEKAVAFSRKALAFFPHDSMTVQLLQELLSQQTASSLTHPKMEDLLEKNHSISLGVEELNELEHIFQNQESDEHLFEQEKQEPLLSSISDAPKELFSSSLLQIKQPHGDDVLELKMGQFQKQFKNWLISYTQQASLVSSDACRLYLLNGWSAERSPSQQKNLFPLTPFESTDDLLLLWQGVGVVINPGKHFIEYFHSHGFHIRDIHYVIVTQDTQDSYANIQAIYTLNEQVNSLQAKRHEISSYLHQKAYEDIGENLKVLAQGNVHSLPLSQGKVSLSPIITLNFFALESTQRKFKYCSQHTLGLRLEFLDKKNSLRFGYMSKSSWSPLSAQELKSCDLVVAGYGQTEPTSMQQGLGYQATQALLEAIKPKLLILVDFSGEEGDVRLEVAKKLRDHCQKKSVIPGDLGLCMDLSSFCLRDSEDQEWINLQDIKVSRHMDPFGPLRYFSSRNLL